MLLVHDPCECLCSRMAFLLSMCVRLQVANDLLSVIPRTRVVLLCDDSTSMRAPISEESTDPFAPKLSTRWLELKQLAAILIDFLVALRPEQGIDILFLNRPGQVRVTSRDTLGALFGPPPNGSTPLIGRLQQVMWAPVRSLMQPCHSLCCTVQHQAV